MDYYDTRVQGLSLKVLPSGRQTYYLRYRDPRDKIVERKLGNGAVMKLSEARKAAQDILAKVAMGEDPFETRRTLKQVPTVAAFVETSYLPHAKSYKRSWKTDHCLLNKHILPAIGELHVDEVKRQHIVDIVSRLAETLKPASVNRTLILMRYLFNCMLKWEVPGMTRNPTAGVPLLTENNKRERYLKEDEALRLFKALEASPNPHLLFIIAMLLLTGARKGEVLNARWSDIDLDKRLWRIEFNKSGQTRHVPLSNGMLSLLDQLPRVEDNDYLLPNPKTGQPYTTLFRAWDNARRKAGLADLRIHDLRHSFASYVINQGHSLYEVQKLLGHTQVKTTQRYAHLTHESLLTAADTAAASVPWDREAREGEDKGEKQEKVGQRAKALPAGRTERPARQQALPRDAPSGQTVSPPPSGEPPDDESTQ
ncbi:tyrosine-type recombinase/integrase [Halomonas campisalis]|uniref:Tyrosine-type recombinase/integrase n=2 Tax=Billgrantia campisalis TaxID=74661 RepID=A0ABS9PDJ0_9GAMM|nr:tyrosine-type recombinase/integrase [Halomonas campisalis]